MSENQATLITMLLGVIAVFALSFGVLFVARFVMLLRGPNRIEVALGAIHAEVMLMNNKLHDLVEQAKLTRRTAERIEFGLGQIEANISPDDDEDEDEDDDEDEEDDGDYRDG